MKKRKVINLQFCLYIAILMMFAPAIFCSITKSCLLICVAICLVGMILYVSILFIGKTVYVCPRCKTKIDCKYTKADEIAPRTGFAVLTCPKCKKTDIMLSKIISREEYKKISYK